MKNKKLVIMLLVMIVAVLATGCFKNEKGPDSVQTPGTGENEQKKELTVKDLYPLNEGDYWKFAGEGNEFAAFEQKVLFREGDRVQLQVASGGTVMGIIYEFTDGKLEVVYSQEEFYEEENILDRENQMSQVILQEPIVVGNTWSSAGRNYKIEDVDATVETPAGEFTGCVVISSTGDEDNVKNYVYYKPGLGLIKQEYVGPDYKIIAELEDFNVKTYNK